MKQLYYTSCIPGRSIGGASGFQVRAMSRGIAPEIKRAAESRLGYWLPTGTRPDQKSVDSAPVRLAYTDIPDVGRVLYHSVYAGQDPTTSRFGNFFSHLLLELPESLDASRAIRLWGSAFWQRADCDGPTELQDTGEVPAAGVLKTEDLSAFLADTGKREMVSLALNALLTEGEEKRVFLAADSEDVARCVMAITRTLPPALTKDLTFSTYESNPLTTYARIVGCCWAAEAAASNDLPSSCYSGQAVAFNAYSGRRSNDVPVWPFTNFAVESLASRNAAALDNFLRICAERQIDDLNSFHLAFRIRPGSALNMSDDDIWEAGTNPRLCHVVFENEELTRRLMTAALRNEQRMRKALLPVLESLSSQEKLSVRTSVWEAGCAAIRSGTPNCVNALEAIFQVVAKSPEAIWKKVVDSIEDPSVLSVDMRCQVAGIFVVYPSLLEQCGATMKCAWFSIPADRLRQLLKIKQDEQSRRYVFVGSLMHEGTVTPEFERALAEMNDADFTIRLVAQVAESSGQLHKSDSNTTLALHTFLGGLSQWKEPNELFVALFRRSDKIPKDLLSKCIRKAIKAGRVDLPAIVRRSPEKLLEPNANEIVTEAVFMQLSLEDLQEKNVRRFMKTVASDESTPGALARAADSLLTVGTFMERPTLEPEKLFEVGKCLESAVRTRPNTLDGVVDAFVKALCRSQTHDLVPAIVALLTTAGSSVTGGPVELYRRIYSAAAEDRILWKHVPLLEALARIAAGNSGSRALDKDLPTVLGNDLSELATNARKYGGLPGFKRLDDLSANWPGRSRERWEAVVKTGRLRRPSLFTRIIRGFFKFTNWVWRKVFVGKDWVDTISNLILYAFLVAVMLGVAYFIFTRRHEIFDRKDLPDAESAFSEPDKGKRANKLSEKKRPPAKSREGRVTE